MIVPAGMVNVAPLSTETLPFKAKSWRHQSFVSVFPSNVESA